ncbi:MAG: hypothetical protein K5787_12515 [Lentisphaeria bacterium]|nr:hypothetical protein [Victivallales bacterium]MCR4574579.1 hypothetical protein [Lentisphaeria bacterium]
MELAIYFSNLKRLEQMDDALRYIDTKNISTYLFGVIFSLNPNLYEYSVNLNSLTWVQSIQEAGYDFSRLYFGQEFCQNLIPSPDELEQAYYIAMQLGWHFTYVTNGYLTEEGNDKIRANIERLKQIEAQVEIVVNDWGVLNIIQNEYQPLLGHLILGRILNKQTRLNLFSHQGQMPPVHMSSIDTPEKDIRIAQLGAFRDISLSNPDYLPAVKQWGFTGVDLDMTPQAVTRPDDGWGLFLGFYFPWNFIATARNCPTAGVADPQRTFVMTDKPCGRACQVYNCSNHLLQYDQAIVQRGPTLFCSAADFLDEYFTGKIPYERLIYEPYLPI